LEQIALLFDGKDATVATTNPVADEIINSKKEMEPKAELVEDLRNIS
jgi:hypothetical protein